MPFSSIIVGEPGCPVWKIVDVLRSSSSFHLFHEKFFDISIDLETPREVIKKCRQDLILDKITFADAAQGLLENWVARRGTEATLKELVGILKENCLKDCAESLEKAFEIIQTFPAAYKKYLRINPGVEDFLSATNQLKRICIIPTTDVSITCEKFNENVEGCVIHNYEDFLKIASVKELSGNQDPLYYVTIDSLKQIKKVLMEILDRSRMEFRTVVVTCEDNYEGLVDLLQSNSNWEQTVQICTDPMEWNDLTLAHKNEIEKSLKERYHVDLDEVDDLNYQELSGHILVDLIKKNKFNLFKDTIPEQLNYYVQRTLITRNVISTSIFDQSSSDIFLFSGIKRDELNEFVKNKLADISTNQVQRKAWDVNHIVLDHPSHFDLICGKTSTPVHFLQFEDGRLRWMKSRGKVTILQNNLEEAQDRLSESEFCDKLGTNSNMPVVIADSPGMGKSILLANIGRRLSTQCKGRQVFFILAVEFMRKIKETGMAYSISAIKACLQNMLCENVVGKLILNSKLNSESGILIELMLDGFDELNPSDSELALGLLRTIKESLKSIRLWITTRHHLLHDLENAVETLGYNIQPFDEDDQIKFLTGFWQRKTNMDESKLTTFAKECLQVLQTKMNSREQDIAGIPLQCLLIGEVFEEDAITLANSEKAFPPTANVSSITDLYAALVAKKTKKYCDLHANRNKRKPIEDDILMKMHARLALELIFPEHNKKFQHSSGMDYVEDILQVGMLEPTCTTTTPRFIHRTVAEYFVAWSVVNQLGTQEVIDFPFKTVFSCHAAFSNNVGVDSFVFSYPVVCYFIDSLLPNFHFHPDNIRSLEVGCSADTKQIAHSFVNANLLHLFKHFFPMKAHIFDKYYHFHSAIRRASPPAAVQRCDYSIVSYFVREKKLRLLLEESTKRRKTIIRDCVENNSAKEVGQRINVIRSLISINPNLMEETNAREQTPLHCKYVHVRLISELIHLGANVLAKDVDNDTLLHVRHRWRDLSYEDFHLPLTNIPEYELKFLVNVKGKHGHTPLATLLERVDPVPETPLKIMNAGTDFNCVNATGPSILEIAINNERNWITLQTLLKYGAEPVGCRARKGQTALHYAIMLDNFDSAWTFLNDDQSKDVNFTDGDGFDTQQDYETVSIYKLNGPKLYVANYAQLVLRYAVLVRKRLMRNVADINSFDNYQRSALILTVPDKNAKHITLMIVKCIIGLGAAVLMKIHFNGKFLHTRFSVEVVLPLASQLHSLAEYLLNIFFARLFNTPGGKYEQGPLQLMWQYLVPEMQILFLLQSRGANFSDVDNHGHSPLTYVVKGGRSTQLLSTFVMQFGENQKCLIHNGENFLHYSALFGALDALKIFTDNARTTNDKTTLIYAAHTKRPMMDVLIKGLQIMSFAIPLLIHNSTRALFSSLKRVRKSGANVRKVSNTAGSTNTSPEEPDKNKCMDAYCKMKRT